MAYTRTLPERMNDTGKLPAYAFPGGYPIYYLDSENSVLCADCATKSADDPDEVQHFKPISFGVIEDAGDDDLTFCGQCSKNISGS